MKNKDQYFRIRIINWQEKKKSELVQVLVTLIQTLYGRHTQNSKLAFLFFWKFCFSRHNFTEFKIIHDYSLFSNSVILCSYQIGPQQKIQNKMVHSMLIYQIH